MGGWLALGIALARFFPAQVQQGSRWIGPFLYWVGVPLSIIGFLRLTPLEGGVWLAVALAYVSYGVAWGSSWVWRWWRESRGEKMTAPQWASFQLAAMLGNTGYIGYPVCLAVGGTDYFGWAILFDMLGTLFGAYGIGTWVAAQAGGSPAGVTAWTPRSVWDPWIQVSRSPAIWGFWVGIATKGWVWPELPERLLTAFSWGMIPLTLVLLGVRLAKIPGGQMWGPAWAATGIRLVLVPLVIGGVAAGLPIPPLGKLVVIVQAGMPPAMATLVLAETYHLDRDLTVATLALGMVGVLLTLPVWLWLWGPG